MKQPCHITGDDLAEALVKFGYHVTRHTDCHIRLSTTQNGEHHVTIPVRDPLKVETLEAVLSEIEIPS